MPDNSQSKLMQYARARAYADAVSVTATVCGVRSIFAPLYEEWEPLQVSNLLTEYAALVAGCCHE